MHQFGAVMVNANAGFNHRLLKFLNRLFAGAVQQPLVAKGLNLFGQGIASVVLVDGVIIALGIERRVKVNQVDACFRHLLHNRQAVAIIERIHPNLHLTVRRVVVYNRH